MVTMNTSLTVLCVKSIVKGNEKGAGESESQVKTRCLFTLTPGLHPILHVYRCSTSCPSHTFSSSLAHGHLARYCIFTLLRMSSH